MNSPADSTHSNKPLKGKYQWTRYDRGYEVSTRGDDRFSAFKAVMSDGRTIEQIYQCDTKGYQPGGRNWRLGKGKPPKDLTVDLWAEYLNLWRTWCSQNPKLLEELREVVKHYNFTLRDRFAFTVVNQAHALAVILNETEPSSKEITDTC